MNVISFEPLLSTNTFLLSEPDVMMTGVVPTVMVLVTVRLPVSMTETLFEPEFATYTRVPSARAVMAAGALPTVMVFSSAGGFTSALKALMLLLPEFRTYRRFKIGSKASAEGALPTASGGPTVSVDVSITEIELLPRLATNNRPLGLMAAVTGEAPTGKVAVTAKSVVEITLTVPLP